MVAITGKALFPQYLPPQNAFIQISSIGLNLKEKMTIFYYLSCPDKTNFKKQLRSIAVVNHAPEVSVPAIIRNQYNLL